LPLHGGGIAHLENDSYSDAKTLFTYLSKKKTSLAFATLQLFLFLRRPAIVSQ
jgi:hypothetical protein